MTPLKRTRRPAAHAPALLTVDVGNSETTLGVFQDETLVLTYRLSSRTRTSDEIYLLLRQMLAPESIDLAGLPCVLCSVVPPLTDDLVRALTRLTGTAPYVVGPHSAPGLVNRYHDPETVGPDRLANAFAARELYGAPAIVVDLGTATTFDVIGPEGDFKGGAIAPGMQLAAEALFARAARLGKVELVRPQHAIGRSTVESLQSGIVLGYAGLVDSLVSRILVELGGEATVVATGGLARVLEGEATTLERFDDALTLQGLRLLHEANAHGTPAAPRAKPLERGVERGPERGIQRVRRAAPAPAPEPDDEPDDRAVPEPAPDPAAASDAAVRKRRRGRRGGRGGRGRR